MASCSHELSSAFSRFRALDLLIRWGVLTSGAVVKRRTRDREVPGSIPTDSKCCFLEQETLSTLLSTGFYPGKRGPHGRLVLDY